MRKLGIIAGGGELPQAIAESAKEHGRAVFVISLGGAADSWVSAYPSQSISIGEAGKTLSTLRKEDCQDVILAGRVQRPKFNEIRLDAKGMMVLPRVLAAARKGDDALLRILVDLIEGEGHRVVSVAEAAPGLIVGEGVLGRVKPNDDHQSDIARGFAIVAAMGAHDVGQAAAVCEGLPLAVEAAEGTDAMLARITTLPDHIRGVPGKPRGVLVKAPKPIQDGKTDLPVVGVTTIRNAAAAGLAGIAVRAGAALIVDRKAVVAAADQAGLFLIGVAA